MLVLTVMMNTNNGAGLGVLVDKIKSGCASSAFSHTWSGGLGNLHENASYGTTTSQPSDTVDGGANTVLEVISHRFTTAPAPPDIAWLSRCHCRR